MGDPLVEQPIKTLTNNEVSVQIYDASGTNSLSPTAAGHAVVDQGVAAALSGAWPVEITDGTNVLGTSTHPVRTDPTGTTTQPVSGTVTANQGTAAALGGAWPVEVTDGTNVLGTSSHPLFVTQTSAGTPVDTSSVKFASLAAGSSHTFSFSAVTNAKTGYLKQWGATSTAPLRAVLQKNIATVVTDLRTRMTSASNPQVNLEFDNNQLSIAGNGTDFWQVTLTNLDNNHAADVYTDAAWLEQ